MRRPKGHGSRFVGVSITKAGFGDVSDYRDTRMIQAKLKNDVGSHTSAVPQRVHVVYGIYLGPKGVPIYLL